MTSLFMSNTPIAMLVSPANNPMASDDTNNVVNTITPPIDEADLTTNRSERGKTRNSTPVPMNVQPNIFLMPGSPYNFLETRGATTSSEKMKIKSEAPL
ncbi:MAG: hypothetical protein WC568_01890 [Candidatus Methanoperedens sp.]